MRPRFAARRKIPAAALGLKKYFFDTSLCRTADKEHSLPSLGEVEITRVQHAVADHIPALPKSFKDRGHIPSGMRAKEPWDIFKEPPRRLADFRNPEDFAEETGSCASESASLRNARAGSASTVPVTIGEPGRL